MCVCVYVCVCMCVGTAGVRRLKGGKTEFFVDEFCEVGQWALAALCVYVCMYLCILGR